MGMGAYVPSHKRTNLVILVPKPKNKTDLPVIYAMFSVWVPYWSISEHTADVAFVIGGYCWSGIHNTLPSSTASTGGRTQQSIALPIGLVSPKIVYKTLSTDDRPTN